MQEPVAVQCPWCFEHLTLWVAWDDLGTSVVDCEVCCRPWRVTTWRTEDGTIRGTVERS